MAPKSGRQRKFASAIAKIAISPHSAILEAELCFYRKGGRGNPNKVGTLGFCESRGGVPMQEDHKACDP